MCVLLSPMCPMLRPLLMMDVQCTQLQHCLCAPSSTCDGSVTLTCVHAGSVSADAYLAALAGTVGNKKSIKAQVAAMESFIAAAEQRLLPGSQIIPHLLR